MTQDQEDEAVRSTALRNVQSILAARQRAEQELLLAKQQLERQSTALQATLDSTTDAILVVDNAGVVTGYNARFMHLWGIDADEMALRDHAQLISRIAGQARDHASFRARVDEIHRTMPVETRDVIDLVDDRIVEQFTKIQVIAGRAGGRVWSFRDITERRLAERDHAHLAAIVASSSDAIISKNLDGVVTSWNIAAERMFGYSAAEMVGRPLAILIPPDRQDEERQILSQLRQGLHIEHFETLRLRKDGRTVHVTLTISPVWDEEGRIIGISKIARDITEREHLLAQERASRARAEEESRLKDEFLATVSHELRTPLNAILGWAQLLRGGKLDAERSRHGLEVVERNARNQAQVIEDLLDVSRIITGKLRLNVQPVMPAAVIQSALDSVSPMAEAKEIRIHTMLDSGAGPVAGDASRLQQVFWNLLTNAIKFTPRGGRVDIRLERIESYLEISVTDSGEGVDPQFLPHVFDRFRQADSSASRHSGGLGLGLAIVRHIVELHGGDVTARSPGKGQGSTFAVRLPLRAVHGTSESEPRAHPGVDARGAPPVMDRGPALEGVGVLVVDDERDTRELLRVILEDRGADVREAGSSRHALEVLEQWTPQVIVSDIGMPGEDGYAFIREVRKREDESGTLVPAVALTAFARSEDRMRALVAGYQVHMAKPISPMEFILVVAGLAARASRA